MKKLLTAIGVFGVALGLFLLFLKLVAPLIGICIIIAGVAFFLSRWKIHG